MHYYRETELENGSDAPDEPPFSDDGDWDDDGGGDGTIYNNCQFYNGRGPLLSTDSVHELVRGAVSITAMICITVIVATLIGR